MNKHLIGNIRCYNQRISFMITMSKNKISNNLFLLKITNLLISIRKLKQKNNKNFKKIIRKFKIKNKIYLKWIAFAVGKKLDTNKKKIKPKIEIFVHLKTLDKKRLITKTFLLKNILMEIINQMLNNKQA